MGFLGLHSDESVEIGSTQKIEKCAFYAICEVVSKDKLVDSIFFCLFFEFIVSSLPELCFTSFFGSFSGDNSDLGVVKKCANKFLISKVSCSSLVITMYKK